MGYAVLHLKKAKGAELVPAYQRNTYCSMVQRAVRIRTKWNTK